MNMAEMYQQENRRRTKRIVAVAVGAALLGLGIVFTGPAAPVAATSSSALANI
jgi:hypothetical protein